MDIRRALIAKPQAHARGFIIKLKSIAGSFSKAERAIFIVALIVLIGSTLAIVEKINEHFMVVRPAYGGSISEGIIGTPRFINPVLATSDADHDLAALIYSGLMRKLPDGDLVPDLAESYRVSDDGLTYTFVLKSGLTFHDKKPLTADDVVFTVNEVKDTAVKSPKLVQWEGVTVAKTDERTVVFTLKQPYAAFLEHTTLGILPAHLWSGVTADAFAQSDLNINPIGSGPYSLQSIKKVSGVPSYYALHSFDHFSLGRPFIKNIKTIFYTSEETEIAGWKNGDVDNISGIEPGSASALAASGAAIDSTVLPRVFGLFFNQNQNPLFADHTLAAALEKAIDKEAIVKEVLAGYGKPIGSPLGYDSANSASDSSYDPAAASDMLAKDGWQKNADGILAKTTKKKTATTTATLTFTIATSNTPELKKATELVVEDLAKIGVTAVPKYFEASNLNQEVIRPRKYDALFFGEIVTTPGDLFAFWHSSERLDPGLNIALYANPKVDKLLEDALTAKDEAARAEDYKTIETEITNDKPAIFIYSPDFIYIVNSKINNLTLKNITIPSDRFSTIYTWYVKTDKIWKVFAKKQ